MTNFKWADPPSPDRQPGPGATLQWDEIVAELEANPGRWMLLASGVSVHNAAVSPRRSVLRRNKACRVISRTVDGEINVYAQLPAGEESC
jgi:hypothetical protein